MLQLAKKINFFQQKVSDTIHSSQDRVQETPGPGFQLVQEDIFIYGYPFSNRRNVS